MLTTDLVFGAKIRRIFVQKKDVKRLVFLCGFPEMPSCFSFSFFMLMSGYCHFLLPFKGVKRVQSCHERHMQYMLVLFCKEETTKVCVFALNLEQKCYFCRMETSHVMKFTWLVISLQFRNERGDERKTPGEKEIWRLLSLPDNSLKRTNFNETHLELGPITWLCIWIKRKLFYCRETLRNHQSGR